MPKQKKMSPYTINRNYRYMYPTMAPGTTTRSLHQYKPGSLPGVSQTKATCIAADQLGVAVQCQVQRVVSCWSAKVLHRTDEAQIGRNNCLRFTLAGYPFYYGIWLKIYNC